jgi:hypothetical protein
MCLFDAIPVGADKNQSSAAKAQEEKPDHRDRPTYDEGVKVEVSGRLGYSWNPVTAAAAAEKQIECYRKMTGEQRLAIALDLHELSCELAREGIRRQHPNADADEVERLLRFRIELSRAP